MKQIAFPVAVGIAMFGLVAGGARRVAAHDETGDVDIKVMAPLDAADCTATPPTITVLGLQIDVDAARIETPGGTSSGGASTADDPGAVAGDSGSHRQGSRAGGTTSQPGCYYSCPTPVAVSTPAPVPTPPTSSACGALVVGQTVEVTLKSDAAPLSATEVKQGSGNQNVEVEGPIQNVDTTGKTITVLGLTIDVSGAGLDGADDDSSDGNSQPIDLSELMTGQFVEVRLASNVAPLAATELEVKNFANQVEVDIEDANGNAIDDVDDQGNPVDDVDVDVAEKVLVQGGPATTGGSGLTRKTVVFNAASNGRFVLSGLPTGGARITVTRLHDGVRHTGRGRAVVKGNSIRTIQVRLRHKSH